MCTLAVSYPNWLTLMPPSVHLCYTRHWMSRSRSPQLSCRRESIHSDHDEKIYLSQAAVLPLGARRPQKTTTPYGDCCVCCVRLSIEARTRWYWGGANQPAKLAQIVQNARSRVYTVLCKCWARNGMKPLLTGRGSRAMAKRKKQRMCAATSVCCKRNNWHADRVVGSRCVHTCCRILSQLSRCQVLRDWELSRCMWRGPLRGPLRERVPLEGGS